MSEDTAPSRSGDRRRPLGGVVHVYQRYDPVRLPPPREPQADVVSGAMDHLLMTGGRRRFTPEELADAVRIDPSQIAGLGPSLDALIAMLEERRRRILERHETRHARAAADRAVRTTRESLTPPPEVEDAFRRDVHAGDLRSLERLWYTLDESTPFARGVLHLMERIGERFEVDRLASRWTFTGRERMDVETALAVKAELERIEELLRQLREALENARPAVIDMEALAEFASQEQIDGLEGLQRRVNELLQRLAEEQGLEFDGDGFRVTPKAMRLYQSKLLDAIFSDLRASRSGRHVGAAEGDGAVELPSTRAYEFGDDASALDLPRSLTNAIVRRAGTPGAAGAPLQLRSEDLEVHRTRNSPKCATAVVMDMSGSMRHGGQYVDCKKMALALDGLIRSEFPGDLLHFVEMYTLAKARRISELPELMPKPVSIRDPLVRLRADMSDPRITELDLPLHFTNIQHALRLSRLFLAAQSTANRQIILITDGLPTAHFEGEQLLMLYPPDPRTEEATMREAALLERDGIVLNVFLVPSWSQSEEDIRFAQRMAESTRGRVFFTQGSDLDRFVVWDYLARRRSLLG